MDNVDHFLGVCKIDHVDSTYNAFFFVSSGEFYGILLVVWYMHFKNHNFTKFFSVRETNSKYLKVYNYLLYILNHQQFSHIYCLSNCSCDLVKLAITVILKLNVIVNIISTLRRSLTTCKTIKFSQLCIFREPFMKTLTILVPLTNY